MKLTTIDKDLDDLRARTPTGMAHWAGTGPPGITCRECSSYEFVGYKTNRGDFRGGMLKDGVCKKYADMTRSKGYKIPFGTPSCKYFKANPEAPPIVNPRKDR